MATISIALATHNGAKYLATQLDSLAQQTKLPVELVVADDCSDDGTLDIVRKFAADAPFPVKILIGKARVGYRRNFIHAAGHCSGDLVAFCDQDDVWEPDKLAVMERPFDDPQVLLAYHNATLIDADGKPSGRLHPGKSGVKTFTPLARHPWLDVPGFAQVFRRELTAFSSLHDASYDINWPNEPLAHDQWFLLIASALGSIVFIRRPLASYRQHSENVFGAYTDRRARYDHLIGAERFMRAAAAAARNRREILNRLVDMLPESARERAQVAVAFYDDLGNRLDERFMVYEAPSSAARVKALFKLLRAGGYSRTQGPGRFTGLDLLVDAYFAAPWGPGIRRLLR